MQMGGREGELKESVGVGLYMRNLRNLLRL